jgi:hypothetical protein
MKRTTIVTFCLILFIIGGCTHTELTRRYKSKNYAKAPADKKYVEVSAFVMTPPPSAQQTLLSQITTPAGQAALIAKMSQWAKSPEELYKALVVSKKGPEGSGGIIDKTAFTKRVVFSVEKIPPGKKPDDLTPADRISFLKVTLKLPKDEKVEIKEQNETKEIDKKEMKEEREKKVTSKGEGKTPNITNKPIFEDCNKFDNKYQTMDFGTLKRTQHGTFTGTIEVGPAADVKVPIKGSATGSRETTIDEEIHLSQRSIEMVGAIKDNKKTAEIFQESQVGYDLTGNFSVDFTIRLTNHNHSGFIILSAVENGDKAAKTEEVKKDGKAAKTKKVKEASKLPKPEEFKIDFGSLIYSVNSEPVHCNLASDYIIRHVRQLPLYDRYDRELAEGFHRVVFVSGSSKKVDVELISKRELKTVIYKIYLKGQVKKPLFLGRPVFNENNESRLIDINPLRFIKFDDAKRFLVRLKESKSAKFGKYMIYKDKHNAIDKKDIDNLRIMSKDLN